MPRKRVQTPDLTARGAFAAEFNGCKNMLTPHVLKYDEFAKGGGSPKRLLLELSFGADSTDVLYGVCFLEDDGSGSYRRLHALNDSFHSRREANKYIAATSSTWIQNGQPE